VQYSELRKTPAPCCGKSSAAKWNFVPLVQLLQSFERADLATAVGGMQKIRFHPKNFHA
jgi:hypothetical protein